jgi:hypothetical protein
MNEITLLREAGPQAPALRAEVRSAARAAVLAEIEGRPARRRRPSRKATVRIGIGLVAVAAAWAAAVVVAAPDGPGTPATSVTLVAFDPPTFPFVLDPAPAGLSPSYSADPGDVRIAVFGAGGRDSVGLRVSPDEPDLEDTSDEQDVTVHGRDAELATEHVVNGEDDVRAHEVLVVEWSDDRWVELTGNGRYDDRRQLLAVARTLVPRPQPVPLQVHLAPAGWSVLAYKDDRILTLVNDAYEEQTLSVHLPLPQDVSPPDQLRGSLMGPVGPLMTVSVQGRPAYLVRIDAGGRDQGWYLQAQFGDGTTFVVQAPEAFTQAQVLAFAEQVTHNP